MKDRKRKTFLECMFNDLDDIHEGSDEQVKQELIEMGVDIEKAKKSFQATLAKCRNPNCPYCGEELKPWTTDPNIWWCDECEDMITIIEVGTDIKKEQEK